MEGEKNDCSTRIDLRYRSRVGGIFAHFQFSAPCTYPLAFWLERSSSTNAGAALTFDVALHMGTLLAVVLYFWKDWVKLFKAALQRRPSDDKRIFWYLVVATIPGGLFGLALAETGGEHFS